MGLRIQRSGFKSIQFKGLGLRGFVVVPIYCYSCHNRMVTLNPTTLNPKPYYLKTLNPTTLNPKPYYLKTLNPTTLNPKPYYLKP